MILVRSRYAHRLGTNVHRVGGPERVTHELPPEGWTPPLFRGFTQPPTPETEPQLWEGDQA